MIQIDHYIILSMQGNAVYYLLCVEDMKTFTRMIIQDSRLRRGRHGMWAN